MSRYALAGAQRCDEDAPGEVALAVFAAIARTAATRATFDGMLSHVPKPS